MSACSGILNSFFILNCHANIYRRFMHQLVMEFQTHLYYSYSVQAIDADKGVYGEVSYSLSFTTQAASTM